MDYLWVMKLWGAFNFFMLSIMKVDCHCSGKAERRKFVLCGEGFLLFPHSLPSKSQAS
jgi:hypothetical protein